MKRPISYSDNQAKAIRHIQYLSYNDEEFRDTYGFRELKFNDVINCGFWTPEELESIGRSLTDSKPLKLFRENSTIIRKRYASKLSLGEQINRKSRSLNDKDGVIQRPTGKRPRIKIIQSIFTTKSK